MNNSSENREAAARIAQLEKRLSDEQRQRYEAIKQQHSVERERAQKALAEREKAYRAEQRKIVSPGKREPHVDGSDLRKFRQVAHDMVVQQDGVELLATEHQREIQDFLIEATATPAEPASEETSAANSNDRATRMQERLEAAHQAQSKPDRGHPGWE